MKPISTFVCVSIMLAACGRQTTESATKETPDAAEAAANSASASPNAQAVAALRAMFGVTELPAKVEKSGRQVFGFVSGIFHGEHACKLVFSSDADWASVRLILDQPGKEEYGTVMAGAIVDPQKLSIQDNHLKASWNEIGHGFGDLSHDKDLEIEKADGKMRVRMHTVDHASLFDLSSTTRCEFEI